MKIEMLSSKPAGVTAPVGKVYKYFKITHSENLKESVIKTANIAFIVDSSWPSKNGGKTEDVLLERYTDKWHKLVTVYEGPEVGKLVYLAKTPGFSYFAIAIPGTATSTDDDTSTWMWILIAVGGLLLLGGGGFALWYFMFRGPGGPKGGAPKFKPSAKPKLVIKKEKPSKKETL